MSQEVEGPCKIKPGAADDHGGVSAPKGGRPCQELEGRGKEFVNNLCTLRHKISTFCMLCLTKYPEYHCFIFAVRLINSSNPSEKSPHL